VVEVNWDKKIINKNINKYGFSFNVLMIDRPNGLMDLVKVIADHKINLIGVNSNSFMENGDRLVNVKLNIEIADKEEAVRLKNNLRKLEGIISVNR
jgi:(p)ppGpp synthase/HD superfamily hydrolase